MAGKRKGTNGAGRYASTKGAKKKGLGGLPPRKRGNKTMKANPMANGGNC